MTIKEIVQDINQKERLFIVILAVLLIIVTTLPYLYGYLTAPKNTYFLAVSTLNRVDYPNYFSYIEQAKSGHWLFKDLYTTETQPRIILNLFFLTLGLIAKAFHLSALQIFQASRIILIPVFLFIFYVFISFLFKKKQKRKICLFLVCFSSGLGVWFLPLLSNFLPRQQPMDLWPPEAITFLTLYTNPLFIFSLILIVLIFFLMLLALENKNYKYALIAGLLGLFLFQVHPYHFPTVFLVLSLFWLILFFKEKQINWLFFKYCLILFIVSLPSLFYYWWLSSTHWLTIHRISQAAPAGFTPPWFSFLIGYGLLIPLVLIGIYNLLKCGKINKATLFLITWLGAQIFLIYSPLPLQRKMSEGLHLIICILATSGIFFLYQELKKRISYQKLKLFKNKFLWSILFFFLFFSSNIFIVAKDLTYFPYPYFSVPEGIIEAMTWLKKNSSEESRILSRYDLRAANLIPAFAVRKTYVGHGVETIDFKKKKQETSWFFETNNHDQEKQAFLKTNKIDYLFFRKENNEVFQPQKKEYLEEIFENKKVSIYQTIL